MYWLSCEIDSYVIDFFHETYFNIRNLKKKKQKREYLVQYLLSIYTMVFPSGHMQNMKSDLIRHCM